MSPLPHGRAVCAVMLGGACGAMSRAGLNAAIMAQTMLTFPLGILCINLIGGLCMGVVQGLLDRRARLLRPLPALVQPLFATGFLGGFTTFSTFAMDTVRLGLEQDMALALLNVVASVILCVGAAALGYRLLCSAG